MHDKHDMHDGCCHNFDESFFGSVTVGERGQIVIPAEARHQLGIVSGEKLLVMRHPLHKGLMVFKFDAVKDFVDEFSRHLAKLEDSPKEDSA